MAIEYCVHDVGDQVTYAFRHPNVIRHSMILFIDLRNTVDAKVVNYLNYGTAVSEVSKQYFRGRRRGAGDHIPMQWVQASLADVTELPGFSIILHHMIENEQSFAAVYDLFNRLFYADTLVLRVGASELLNQVRGKNQQYFTLALNKRRELKEVKAAETVEQTRLVAHVDWGTW